MTRSRGILAAAAVPLILLGACARPADGTPTPARATVPESAAATGPKADELVIRLASVGGFVPVERVVGRLPQVSVYGDGRVITEGPVTYNYPGPALPNVLVQRITPELLRQLVKQGLEAGVRTGTDYGHPNVADAPGTRVTVVTAGGPQTVTAEALQQSRDNDPRLSPGQQSARSRLLAYVTKLQGLDTGGAHQEPYVPAALAALARPWVAPADMPGGADNTKPWPGPALPGPAVNDVAQQGCVVVAGDQVAPVLAAARTANALTAWTSGYKKWAITFRPLLPDETGCGSLTAAT
jgi:hypothetical protein